MKSTPFLFLFFFLCSSFVVAEDTTTNLTIYNLEVEKLLNLGSGLLALLLAFLTWSAYTRTGNNRLSYVSLAFVLFALKGFLLAHELFFGEWPLIDTVTSILDFFILLAFFIGIIKK
ncbi:MAG: hypothetical protein Q8L34_02865 [Candidatus Woesearchaeota archaeon]|nr:hypothetical protein [Candidatus Woesearchaeota archaeon]